MSTLHAHVETYSTDCDGPMSSGYVMTMNDDELSGQDQDNYFGDIYFHNRVVSSVVNTYSLLSVGRLDVQKMDDSVRLSWSEPTDEGGRSIEATICELDCDLGEDSWRRDHRAEEAGY